MCFNTRMDTHTKICRICENEQPISDFHRDKIKADGYASQCKECKAAYKRVWRKKNRTVIYAHKKEWGRKNGDQNEAVGLYRNGRVIPYFKTRAEINAGKHARKKERRVAFDQKGISAFYRERDLLNEFTDDVWEVDHIIPLCGELVSGLHVATNLQVIKANDNRDKSNYFEAG